MDAHVGPLQIDLIKEMGAHLLLGYYKAQRELQQERGKENRREATGNHKQSVGELMNELLICIEIARLQN